MKRVLLTLFMLQLVFCYRSFCQYLEREPLQKSEIEEGIQFKYGYYGQYDGHVSLILYLNNTYDYKVSSRQDGLNRGVWRFEKDELLLIGDVDRDSIPVKIEYLPDISYSKWVKKTIIDMPVTNKGDFLLDSKVFVNNDSTYFFPFFDTCIGQYLCLDSLKVDFGRGFKSAWVPIKEKPVRLVKIITDIDLSLLGTDYFKRRRFLVRNDKLIVVED